MSEHTPLTEAERDALRTAASGDWTATVELPATTLLGLLDLAARTSTATADEFPAAAFRHDDGGVCLYNAASGTWYANDDGRVLLSPRPICDRTHTTADTDPHALSEAEERELRAERRGYLIGKQEAATADTGPEWSREAHDTRLAKYGGTLSRENVEYVIQRIADYPEIVAAARAATADTGLRERVRWLLAKYAGRSKWVGYEKARREAWDEIERDLRALDATAAPTADTGARDE